MRTTAGRTFLARIRPRSFPPASGIILAKATPSEEVSPDGFAAMPEQRLNPLHLLYDLVLQEAHDVSQHCLERLHDLNSRFEWPDREELRKVEVSWTNGGDFLAREDSPAARHQMCSIGLGTGELAD
jgi:hypothetical protein